MRAKTGRPQEFHAIAGIVDGAPVAPSDSRPARPTYRLARAAAVAPPSSSLANKRNRLATATATATATAAATAAALCHRRRPHPFPLRPQNRQGPRARRTRRHWPPRRARPSAGHAPRAHAAGRSARLVPCRQPRPCRAARSIPPQASQKSARHAARGKSSYGIERLYSLPSRAILYISATYGFSPGVSAPSSTRRAYTLTT